MTRALVTGGSGYFGTLLVRHLREQGVAVAVFDLNDAWDRPADVQFFQGDIRDPAAIATASEGMDWVFHNVAQVPLAKDRALFDSVNEEGTRHMLQAAQRSRVAKVVYTSSSAVYGVPGTNPVTEGTPPKPDEAYGRAKHRGEMLCHEFAAQGLDVSIVRPRTIMGAGRLGIFQIIFEWVRLGRNLPVLGRGDNRYQFVHADDLAAACAAAARRPGATLYNCGAEQFGTMRELLEGLCAHAGTGSRVVGVPMSPAVWGMRAASALGLSPLGPYHSLMYGRSMYFDIAKARRELGWRPLYSNAQMIVESYDWYLSRRDEVLRQSGLSHHRSAVKQGILGLVSRLL